VLEAIERKKNKNKPFEDGWFKVIAIIIIVGNN